MLQTLKNEIFGLSLSHSVLLCHRVGAALNAIRLAARFGGAQKSAQEAPQGATKGLFKRKENAFFFQEALEAAVAVATALQQRQSSPQLLKALIPLLFVLGGKSFFSATVPFLMLLLPVLLLPPVLRCCCWADVFTRSLRGAFQRRRCQIPLQWEAP